MFLQLTRTTIKAWMSLNFGPTPPPTTELAAIERLKIDVQSYDHQLSLGYNYVRWLVCGWQLRLY